MYRLVLLLVLLPVLLLLGCEQQVSHPRQPTLKNLNGKLIYVRHNGAGQFSIVVFNLRTRSRAVRDSRAYSIGGVHLPTKGGEIIAHLQAKQNDPHRIMRFDFRKKTATRIEAIQDRSFYPRFSPGGDRIAYYALSNDHKRQIYIYRSNDNKSTAVPCPGSQCQFPNWHPTENKLVIVVDGNRLVELDLKSNSKQGLYRAQPQHSIRHPLYSPSGDRLMFNEHHKKRTRLLVIDTKDKQTNEIYRHNSSISSACWLGNGSIIAFGEKAKPDAPSNLVVYDFAKN